MASIFRMATKQAILDLIADHSTASRFGHLLSTDGADELATRVVDLFEMTLELRSRTGLIASAAEPTPSPKQKKGANTSSDWTEQPAERSFPKTVNAADFPMEGPSRSKIPDAAADIDDPGYLGYRLPRERRPLTDAERQSFMRRRH